MRTSQKTFTGFMWIYKDSYREQGPEVSPPFPDRRLIIVGESLYSLYMSGRKRMGGNQHSTEIKRGV